MNKAYLQQLEFSDKEAEVYLALNTCGPSPASTIARLTKIKRGSVYDALNSLMGRHLVSSFKKGSYTYFFIDDVKKLLYRAQEKARIAQSIVDNLKSQQFNQGVQINHYIGEEGYREMYEDILRAKPKELMVWIHLDSGES